MEPVVIGSLIGLVVVVAGIYCYYKFFVPKTEDKDSAMDFIRGFKSVFENIIERIISEIDITKYTSILEFETDIFGLAYDECWKYIEAALKEAKANSAIASLVAKAVTRTAVEEIVQKIIDEFFVEKLERVYISRWNETSVEALKEDERLQEEADKYEVGEMEVEPVEEIPTMIEYDKPINPWKEEEEEFNPEDETQEIVTTEVTDTVDLLDVDTSGVEVAKAESEAIKNVLDVVDQIEE